MKKHLGCCNKVKEVNFDFLYSLKRKDKNPKDLKSLYFLQKKLDLEALDFKIIHIAGTNGKGSCAWKLQSILALSGYKTGLFISPHLQSPTERIQINGEQIEEKKLLAYATKVVHLIEKYELDIGFFGIMFFSALLFFKEQKINLGIFEAGIGGLLDSTNILLADLAIITTIGLDHTEILGNTLDAIAYQKAGIIKPNCSLVLGPKAQLTPILQIAKSQKAKVFLAKGAKDFIDENKNIVLKACQVLQKTMHIEKEAIEKGLEQRLMGRLHLLAPNVYFDGAHNPQGFEFLLDYLVKKGSIIACLSFLETKKGKKILDEVCSRVERVHLFSFDHPKATKREELISLASQFSNVSYFSTLKEALDFDSEGKIVLISGSFYLFSHAKQVIEKRFPN